MAEPDPTTQHEQEATAPPEPARPVLASHLLDLEEQQRRRFTGGGKSERLSTTCPEIDELFGGSGVERGIVVGISAAGGSEASMISLHLLATVLLESVALASTTQATLKRKAVVIDSTGAFPITLLAKVIRFRILAERSAAAIRSEESGNYGVSEKEGDVGQDESDVDAEVHRCLEMVALCRVFDFEGLWEVLGEVRSSPVVPGEFHERDLGRNAEESALRGQKRQGKEVQSPEKTAEIVDSEEEDSPINDSSPLKPAEDFPRAVGSDGDDEGSGTEIMIIDSMTHIINDLFSRKAKADGHNLLALLSQTIHNLTHTQNILTILHNSTVPTRSSTHSASNLQTHQQPPSHRHTFRDTPQPPTHQPSPSVFPSNQVKPALGQIFSQFPELHIFLSELPKYRTDAELLYGQGPEPRPDPETETEAYPGGADRTRTRTEQGESTNTSAWRVRYCTIAEILKDETPCLDSDSSDRERPREREPDQQADNKNNNSTTNKTTAATKREFGWRERRWCAVESSPDGVRLKGAFAVKTAAPIRTEGGSTGSGRDSRAYGTEVDSRVGLGVGEVAKVYGFGGRRV